MKDAVCTPNLKKHPDLKQAVFDKLSDINVEIGLIVLTRFAKSVSYCIEPELEHLNIFK